MESSAAKLQILSDFHMPVLVDISTIIGRAYPRAAANAQDRFIREVAHDYYPSERRAIIENSLPNLRDRHPGLAVVPRSNKKHTSYFHQIASNRSVLTVSKTQNPGELPRDADFRKTLARNPQLCFEEYREWLPEMELDPEADAYYGIVTHGAAENDQASVGFIEILIPDVTGTRVLDRIDLFPCWDQGARPTFPVEPIAPTAPRLRIVPRTAEEDTGA